MDLFLKSISVVLLGITIFPVVAQKDKSFTVPLLVLGCCILLVNALQHLRPVVELMERLRIQSSMDPKIFTILMKSTGVGLIAEFSALLCSDAGNASLGKGIVIVSSTTVLWLALPLIEDLLDLIGNILSM